MTSDTTLLEVGDEDTKSSKHRKAEQQIARGLRYDSQMSQDFQELLGDGAACGKTRELCGKIAFCWNVSH